MKYVSYINFAGKDIKNTISALQITALKKKTNNFLFHQNISYFCGFKNSKTYVKKNRMVFAHQERAVRNGQALVYNDVKN